LILLEKTFQQEINKQKEINNNNKKLKKIIIINVIIIIMKLNINNFYNFIVNNFYLFIGSFKIKIVVKY